MYRFKHVAGLIVVAAMQVATVSTLGAQTKDRDFGTTQQISDGFVGTIYFLPRGTKKLPNFRTLQPRGQIFTRSLNVPYRSFSTGFPGVTNRFEWFAVEFRSRLRIEVPGTYKFRLVSDDGSKLYVGGNLVVDNDGIHSAVSKGGQVRLTRGTHTIVVQYFQGPRYNVALQLFWTPPKGKEVLFPGEKGILTTPGVAKPKSVAPGFLTVTARDIRIAGATQVALIVDSSGSMRAKLRDGTRRIDAAKRVMLSVINGLPGTIQVGLRAYGHRYRSKPKRRSCRDSESLVAFSKLDRAAMKLAIARLRPRGQTPIGYSFAQLEKDFSGTSGAKLVLLVSDGIETCDPKATSRYHPTRMIRRLREKGIQVRVNVIGFDIGNKTARRFLQDIARAGDGKYIDANDQRQLERALQEALAAPYDVIGSNGRIIARGAVGRGRVKLKPGNYSVVIRTSPEIRIRLVKIAPNKVQTLKVARRGSEVTVKRQFGPTGR